MKVFPHLADLQAEVGRDFAVSEWVTVDQQRIDRFADATGDHQWIHVDRERAAASPYGTTIAHGFLTLSLLAMLEQHAYRIDDVRMGLNYGLNRVRFPSPVKAGQRVRGRFRLLSYEAIAGGAQLVAEVTVEAEGEAKPACVAESVTRRFV